MDAPCTCLSYLSIAGLSIVDFEKKKITNWHLKMHFFGTLARYVILWIDVFSDIGLVSYGPQLC